MNDETKIHVIPLPASLIPDDIKTLLEQSEEPSVASTLDELERNMIQMCCVVAKQPQRQKEISQALTDRGIVQKALEMFHTAPNTTEAGLEFFRDFVLLVRDWAEEELAK